MNGNMVQYGEGQARAGYLALPESGAGPALLLLHAWWGLNDFLKATCDRFAAVGYVAFAPDLYGGVVVDTVDEASQLVETSDRAAMEGALVEGLDFLLQQPGIRPGGIGAIGFSLGAAYALYLSTLRPEVVAAVVVFYGTYILDFSAAKAAYLGHFAEEDPWEPKEGVEGLEAALAQANRPATFHFYPGTGHWFCEANRADAYKPEAALLAWRRTLAFLAEQLAAA